MMKAIILAAGRGSRMCEATANMPKCMMRVWDEPLISMCLKALEKAGCSKEDIAIVTGYKGEVLRNLIPDVHYFNNERWESTNMVYSMTQAKDWLEKEDCIVCYSDIVFSSIAVKRLMKEKGDIVIPYYTGFMDLWKERFDDPLGDLETFRIDEDKLIEIGQRPKTFEEVMGQYMGIVKFTPIGWKQAMSTFSKIVAPKHDKTDMTTLLNTMLIDEVIIKCVRCDEIWLECDNQNDIAIYNKKYSKMDVVN